MYLCGTDTCEASSLSVLYYYYYLYEIILPQRDKLDHALTCRNVDVSDISAPHSYIVVIHRSEITCLSNLSH
jgi:hypothetical protein